MSYKEAIKVTPLPRMQLLCGSIRSALPVDWTVHRFWQSSLLHILLVFPFHGMWLDYIWIFHLLVQSLCHNIQRRWIMDLPQSDCGLFPLGFIYLDASNFPFLMVNIFIIKSTLSDCLSGPDLPWENQPAEAEQAYETDIVPQEDTIQVNETCFGHWVLWKIPSHWFPKLVPLPMALLLFSNLPSSTVDPPFLREDLVMGWVVKSWAPRW